MPPKAAATKKGGKPPKKEKLFHPQSRKADQLVRAQHRKSKLQDLAKTRSKKQEVQCEQCTGFECADFTHVSCTVDLYSFFYAAIPSEGVLTLQDLHTIIQEVWLTRYDDELEAERAQRRKGRPQL